MTSDAIADMSQVRIAYRLVVAYQRRLLDLFRFVQIGVRDRYPTIRFHGWSPSKWGRPGTTDPTQKWAWDFVPLHHSEIGWVSSDSAAPGSFWFWLSHEADVGWTHDGRGEPDPLAFEPAETCRTVLSASVLACPRGSSPDGTGMDWQKLYTSADPSLTLAEWTDGAPHEREIASGVVRAGGFVVDIETLTSRALIAERMTGRLLKLISEAVQSEFTEK